MAVKGETIDLNYQTRFWPKKIDFKPLDAHVCFGLREPRRSDQAQQASLCFGTGQSRPALMPKERSQRADAGPVTGTVERVRELPVAHNPLRAGLRECRFYLVGTCARSQIDKCPRGRGDGNAVLGCAIPRVEACQPVYTEPLAGLAVPRYNAYFHLGCSHLRKTPEHSRRAMAYEGPVATGEHRREFPGSRELQLMPY